MVQIFRIQKQLMRISICKVSKMIREETAFVIYSLTIFFKRTAKIHLNFGILKFISFLKRLTSGVTSTMPGLQS